MTKYKNKKELGKSFADKLQQIKPWLPKGYHENLLKALPGVSANQIMNAFINRPVAIDILTRIFQKAVELAYETQAAAVEADESALKLLVSLKGE